MIFDRPGAPVEVAAHAEHLSPGTHSFGWLAELAAGEHCSHQTFVA